MMNDVVLNVCYVILYRPRPTLFYSLRLNQSISTIALGTLMGYGTLMAQTIYIIITTPITEQGITLY